VLISF